MAAVNSEHVTAHQAGADRNLAVPLGSAYAPLIWDTADDRHRDCSEFQPQVAPNTWPGHKEICIDLVMRTTHHDRKRDRDLLGTLHRFMTWAKAKGFACDPEHLLVGDRIDLFINKTFPNPVTANTRRWQLRVIAATVFPPPESDANRRQEALPAHSDLDLARLLDARDSLLAGRKRYSSKRLELHRDVTAILALTFGAGCNGRSVHRVQEAWLQEAPRGLELHRPDLEVPIPIGAPWATMVRECLTGDAQAWLVRPGSHVSRSEQVGKVMFKARGAVPAFTGFDADRAARHWQQRLIEVSGCALVVRMLGSKPGSQLPADLSARVTVTNNESTRERMWGWTS